MTATAGLLRQWQNSFGARTHDRTRFEVVSGRVTPRECVTRVRLRRAFAYPADMMLPVTA
jgi:hypothetical protein